MQFFVYNLKKKIRLKFNFLFFNFFYKIYFFSNNNSIMIYFISLITGLLNGVFASGAGQILVIYLVFIKKIETHTARALSVSLLSISSIFALFGYMNFVNFELKYVVVFAIIAAITGIIGTKLMKKIPADILNLISGVLIVSLTLYKMIGGN